MGATLSTSSSNGGLSSLRRGGRTQSKFTAEQFSGIARIELVEASLAVKDWYFATLSMGMQTFRTATTATTDRPAWRSEKKLVLETGGARLARISIFESNKITRNTCVAFCELDLSGVLEPGGGRTMEEHQLRDVRDRSKIVGQIWLSYSAEPRKMIETDFARRVLSLVDVDENGVLSIDEFTELVRAFGNRLSDKEIRDLFEAADTDRTGSVDADKLAATLAQEPVRALLVNRCPVCGERLEVADGINDVIHMWLCFDEGNGTQTMIGSYLTEKQASLGWMFKLSEWASFSAYDNGMKEGRNTSHILVFERHTKRMVEERVDKKIVLSLRAIYHSKLGRSLLEAGTKNMLVSMSQRQGEKMSLPSSALNISKFVAFFEDQINLEEVDGDILSFKTFNEFFTRKLKPGVRPIKFPLNDAVAVCAADSRLMVYDDVSVAQRFWIKGRKFSLLGLLGDSELHRRFEDGSLAIFRLAPQDYHRFHSPVSGTLGAITDIPGHLFTVNPIAVNSKFCDVFTQNKRSVCVLSTIEFGDVAFIAIGATMVGSIVFTRAPGDTVSKGDELGYFAFGGSTCICVFQKGAVQFDEDVVANSIRSLETLVQMGDTLGVAAGETLKGPSAADSVVSVSKELADHGIVVTDAVNAGDLPG